MEPIESSKPFVTTNPLFVVSGGDGTSGEKLVNTVLAPFKDVNVPVIIEPYVHTRERVEAVVARAVAAKATLIHTFVDPELRYLLIELAHAQQVPAFDLFGPLLNHLSHMLGQAPLGRPGLYRDLHQEYFRRVEAIEFTVAHDDGKRVHELAQADIVLVGVSRVGKTPLSVYLSMLGWKVANVPLVPSITPPEELFQVERRRVVGLTVTPEKLLAHRRWREQNLGISGGAYSTRAPVIEEMRAARHLFYQHGIAMIDVTDKPVETSGEEVLALITRQ